MAQPAFKTGACVSMLGTMAAYTPCLIFLAFMLRDFETAVPEASRVNGRRIGNARQVNSPGDPSILQTGHVCLRLACLENLKRHMTIPDAQPVTHRRSALGLAIRPELSLPGRPPLPAVWSHFARNHQTAPFARENEATRISKLLGAATRKTDLGLPPRQRSAKRPT